MHGVNTSNLGVKKPDEEPYEVGIDLGNNVITFTTPRKSNASGNVIKDPVTKIGGNAAQLDSAGKCPSKDQAPPIISSPETIMSVLDPAGKGSSVDVLESADENKSDSVAKNVPGSLSSPNIVNLKNVGNIVADLLKDVRNKKNGRNSRKNGGN